MSLTKQGWELKCWLVEKQILLKDFAKKLDTTPNYLSAIINGHRKPGRRLARDIEAATKNRIRFL